MALAPLAHVLFSRILRYSAQHPNWVNRDRFILSAGHASILQYAMLYLTGYGLTLDDIKNFRQWDSLTPGHPEVGHTDGVEVTTGPLGQGISTSVGMALAERMLNARFGDELVDHFTYVLASDGDLMEGISHEAISIAGHLKLSRLIVLYDDNDISIDGPLDLTESGDALGRFEAAGWDAVRIDGHDHAAIEAAIEAARQSDKPSLIACKTTIGYGSPNKQGTSGVHGAPLGDEEIALTRESLGWSSEPYEIPNDLLDVWRMAGRTHASTRKAWEERLAGQSAETKNRFERTIAGDLPQGLDSAIDDFKKQLAEERPVWATRKASEEALKAIVPHVPEMIGGSADLTGSNNTKTPEQTPVSADSMAGQFIHWGIREHGMAAAMNGMALHGGLVPYGGTFLTFSDYMRPSMRLAALMNQRVGYVLTHDSIFLGEDGPTHQSVEHAMALRLIPGLDVMRPADMAETAASWLATIERADGPTALLLTRQNVPQLSTLAKAEEGVRHGGYVLLEEEGEGEPVILIGTGSELHLCVDAREQLQAQGIPTRVVSMPCLDRFLRADKAVRDSVLPPANTRRVSVEAGRTFGWQAVVGLDGISVGIDTFGESAPAEVLAEHFGFTVKNVVSQALKLV